MDATSKIQLEHVDFVYSAGTPFEKRALEDVSLSIKAGRITGIIGRTGSGKSTMMQLFNGLAAPTNGRVLLDGVDLNARLEDIFEAEKNAPEYERMSRRKVKKALRERIREHRRTLCFRVGLVMQYPEHQLFEETVERDIAFGPRNMGLSEEEITARVLEAARFTELDVTLLKKSPFDLSGGQRRRVAIAGIMAMRPEVLVLDEPAAGLDPQGRDYILNGIYEYQRKTGCTVLIVSHSMEDMARYCDDLIVLSNARTVMQGNSEQIFSRVEELTEIGLDVPQITHLMHDLRAKGAPISADVYTVDAAVEALYALFSKKKDGKGGDVS